MTKFKRCKIAKGKIYDWVLKLLLKLEKVYVYKISYLFIILVGWDIWKNKLL